MHTSSSFLISRTTGFFSIVLGLAVLTGWAFDVDTLKSVLPGLNAMKPNSAMAFLLCGIALICTADVNSGQLARQLYAVSATLLLLLGSVTLSQYVLGSDTGIDPLLFRSVADTDTDNLRSLRMSPQTAVGFTMLGVVLWLLRDARTRTIAQYLLLLFAIVPFLTSIGYLFGLNALPFLPNYQPMALHTVFGFLVVSAGLLASTVDIGLLARLRQKLAGIIYGLGLALLLLCVVGSVVNLRHMTQLNARQIHKQDIVLRFERVANEIEFNISAYRGFVLTGQDWFVAPLEASRQRLAQHLDYIRQHVDADQQQERLNRLESAISHRIALCDEKIRLRQDKGLEYAAQAVAEGQGNRLNYEIRGQIDDIVRVETAAVDTLKTQAEASEKTTLVALSFSLMSGLGLIVLAQAESKLNAGRRRFAESERNRLSAILEATTDVVGMTDPQGNITYINRAGRVMLGLGDGPIDQFLIADAHPAWAYERVGQQGIPYAKTHGSWQGETALLTADGREIPMSQLILAHRSGAGNITFLSTVMRDISEHKHAEKLQCQMLHKLDTIANASPTLLWSAGLDKGCDWFNQRWLAFTGRTLEQEMGAGWLEGVHPDDFAHCLSTYERSFDARQFFSMEYRLRRHDGEYRWLLDQGMPRYDENGAFIGYIGSCLDISEARQTQAMLQRFKSTLDLTQDCVFMFEPQSLKFIYVNQGAMSQVGYTAEELMTMTPLDIKPEFDEAGFRAMIAPLTSGELRLHRFETVHRHKDGHDVPVEISLQHIVPSSESPRFIAIVHDITERKLAEDKLRASETSLKEAQRLAQIGSWELDLDSRQLAWSDEVYRIFEIDPEGFAASYQGFLQAVHPDDRDMVSAAYADSVANRCTYNIVHRLLMADGRIKYVRERGETQYRDDIPVRSMGTVQDITTSKRIEDELHLYRNHLESVVKKRTAELEAVNQELEAFAYSVSHDLRAPLRGIDGFSKALLEDYQDTLDDTGRDYLNRVRVATQRMGILIDELLKLSRITRATLKCTAVDLSQLATEVLQDLQDAEPDHPAQILIQPGLQAHGDSGLLKVALENLLGNAWKYSGKRADPRIEFGSFTDDTETIYFVSDNGVGFDVDYADKLFGAFQRLHHREQFEGSGIGLATVKRIVHRHGGRIWADSKPDEKTTFYFTLSGEDDRFQ